MATTRKIKGCLHEEEAAQIPETGGSVELPRYCGEAAVDIIAVHVPGAIGPSANLPLSAKMRNATPGYRPPKAAITWYD
jgi:hypothetical protein